MKAAALQALVAALLVAAGIALYDRLVLRPALVVGIVDLSEVYRAKETEFTQLLTQTGSDAERDRALALARDFSQRLPAALDELPRECGCLVVIKGAVAGAPHSLDLTPMLRRKVDRR
ncbi:hypothetical protein C1I89_06320 [Achromobacter pulmonis]|uniref:Type-F conjugative transfer system protein TrbI n=1 Tax=Achromobacter pulmonis TaxID=1389932 RepID=A0A2N8KK86_9BURK|nr:hypothetical protein [Achromobacter pulmonis]PND33869.1 hypothetical protein C1I89_06320 [Achromobacter pulmonis]